MATFLNTIKTGCFLGTRSVLRGNKAVLGLTVFMLSLVYINLLFFPALLNGLIENMNYKQRTLETADFIMLPREGKSYFTSVGALKERAIKTEGVKAIASRTTIGAELEFDGIVSTYGIYAITPSEYIAVFDINKYMVEGEFLEDGDVNKIVLGVQVAGAGDESTELYASSLKNVHAGDRVTVRASGDSGTQTSLVVKGIFQTGTVQNDIRSFVTDDAMALAFPLREDTASSIHVKAEEGFSAVSRAGGDSFANLSADAGANEQALAQSLSSLSTPEQSFSVVSWREMTGVIGSITKTFEDIIRIIQFIALLVGGITVFVITYVDIVNKRRQIELQYSIGISQKSLRLGNAVRAVLLAVAGICLGFALYTLVITPLEAAYPFSFPFGDAILVTSSSSYLAMALVLIATSATASVAQAKV